MKNYKNTGYHSNRMWSGLILLIIGCFFLLRNFGFYLPHWVISWHTILLVIGLMVGAKRNFSGGGWLIMVLIGGFFTLQDITHMSFSRYGFAIGFMVLGLFLILKPSRVNRNEDEKEKADFGSPASVSDDDPATDENNYIDNVNVFSGSKQQIISKKFKGGDVVSIFGGCDLNLTQSDFSGTIVLDVIAIFGGVKIIVPPTWTVKSEVMAIFGGLDDKRSVLSTGDPTTKLLIIKGVAMFGGVDIRNF